MKSDIYNKFYLISILIPIGNTCMIERVLPEVKKFPPILLKLCVIILLYNVCIQVKYFSMMVRHNNDVTIFI